MYSIGVAMSGGVDSTVTAGLLLEKGWSVHGFFMLLPLPGLEEQVVRVQEVASQLDIPLHLVDVRDSFREQIISYFVTSYHQGVTPNPCVICNRLIKCGQLMEEMTRQGMAKMATGHYARIFSVDGTSSLHRAIDPGKDQSYFLCRLTATQLDRLILPLGEWHKADVFLQARKMGFHFSGTESQDVCFLANQTLPTFLEQQGIENRCGEIVDTDGQVHGSHNGTSHYTVGQRRGLGIPDATPWYVVGLDAVANRVIIGKNEALFQRQMRLTEVQWSIMQDGPWEGGGQGGVQLRSRHRPASARVEPMDGEHDKWQVTFDEPQRAVTPGQFAVFYEDDQVVGSGVIKRI